MIAQARDGVFTVTRYVGLGTSIFERTRRARVCDRLVAAIDVIDDSACDWISWHSSLVTQPIYL